ncbi:MAG: FAD-binding oxidoreductase [Acidobacteriaceae bacterium]|jgi:FAD/FMN-containing dehydrogenase|nr:FAD-binding oxidoreductase [Acidobacteriaceae bacterium]
MSLSGWGQLAVPGQELRSEHLDVLTRDAVLTRGLGRSYGDSSLPPPDRPVVVATPLADRLLAFDEQTGVLRAEAGYSLQQLYQEFVPRGWFTPVTPGTQFVTLGGMVAADVHGKNHHVDGTIGRHLRRIRLRVASGDIVICSPDDERDLFRATVGGMGLTGHILDVDVQLTRIPSPWIIGAQYQIPNIDEFLRTLKETASVWPFTMGWIDCLSRGPSLGRGVLMCGRWATPQEAPAQAPPRLTRLPIPFTCPSFVMGRLIGRIFNEGYYRWNKSTPPRIIHPLKFFYPLDTLLDWYRLYGRRGFTQHQSVIPEEAGPGAVKQLLELLTSLGVASFLCVIKDCGDQGDGLLSFPMRGTSIALDIPVRDNTQQVIDRLNAYVIQTGGRIYLAKDAFTRAEHYRAMDPRVDEFLAIRRQWDPHTRIRSAQSVRLFGDHA